MDVLKINLMTSKVHAVICFCSDPQGHDVGIVATNQRVSYSCHVDPPYIGSVECFWKKYNNRT